MLGGWGGWGWGWVGVHHLVYVGALVGPHLVAAAQRQAFLGQGQGQGVRVEEGGERGRRGRSARHF